MRPHGNKDLPPQVSRSTRRLALDENHVETLLKIARDYRLICKIVETDVTVEQQEAITAVEQECRANERLKKRGL